jgi:hypothetical protein
VEDGGRMGRRGPGALTGCSGGLSVKNPSADKSGGVTVASGAAGSSIGMSVSPHHEDPGKTPTLAGETTQRPAHLAAPSPAASLSETQAAIKAEAEKAGTNLDTLMGRLVIEQGLATQDEVSHCLEQVKDDRNQRSLAQVLVTQNYVTERQIVRLKQIVEAQRSGQKIPGYKVLGQSSARGRWRRFSRPSNSAWTERGRDQGAAQEVQPATRSSSSGSTPRDVRRPQLNHPNIVQAFDVGKAGEYHYFVMEFVDGPNGLRRHREAQAVQRAGGARHRHPDRRGAAARPREGAGAPRREAQEHHAVDRVRRGEARGHGPGAGDLRQGGGGGRGGQGLRHAHTTFPRNRSGAR